MKEPFQKNWKILNFLNKLKSCRFVKPCIFFSWMLIIIVCTCFLLFTAVYFLIKKSRAPRYTYTNELICCLWYAFIWYSHSLQRRHGIRFRFLFDLSRYEINLCSRVGNDLRRSNAYKSTSCVDGCPVCHLNLYQVPTYWHLWRT